MGELIFESFDPNFKWDGTFNNIHCPDSLWLKLYFVNVNNQFSIKWLCYTFKIIYINFKHICKPSGIAR